MNIISINFTGINANKQSALRGNVSIASNVKVDSIEEAKIGLGEARQAYKILFSYKTQYQPNLALIELKGEVLVLDSAEAVKKMMELWKKDKKMDVATTRVILNNIMNKCALEVILLSKELGLPSPIPLPSIKSQGAEGKTAPAKEDKPAKAKKE